MLQHLAGPSIPPCIPRFRKVRCEHALPGSDEAKASSVHAGRNIIANCRQKPIAYNRNEYDDDLKRFDDIGLTMPVER